MEYIIFSIVNRLVGLYSILLIIFILMSWVPSTRETGIGRVLEKICEPYLGFFRKFIPPFGMIDFSPIVALFVLNLALKGLAVLLF